MSEANESRRVALLRESLLFQVKLIADGFRDFLLVPVSLAATLIGLLRSAEHPETEFNRVLELGRQSERWINLFGQHDPLEQAGDAGSIDRMVSRAEAVVRQQVREGGVSESASSAIAAALDRVHEKARRLPSRNR